MQHSVLIGTLLTRSRLTLGAGLVGALLLSATGCHKSSSSSTSGGTTQPDDDDVLFPFHTPFDFKDSFYLENGVDPAGFAKRLTPDDPAATKGRSLDPTKNNTRILAILGGYDAAGALLYYPKPPAPMTPAAFTPDHKGERAKILANNFRAFLFPEAGAGLLSSAADERRQGNVFDTSSGYFHTNPLGLWRLTFPHYTDDALNTPDGQDKLDELRARNGEDNDGNPLLKRLSEINELEKLGYLDLLQRSEDGSDGPPWVV